LCQLHTAIYIERLRKFHTCSKENIEDIKQDVTSDEINNDCNEAINNSGIGSSKVNQYLKFLYIFHTILLHPIVYD
jgi:hypothetical protein